MERLPNLDEELEKVRKNMSIALRKLVDHQKSLGVNRTMIAKRAGCYSEYVARTIEGKRDMRLSTIVKFAVACGRSIQLSFPVSAQAFSENAARVKFDPVREVPSDIHAVIAAVKIPRIRNVRRAKRLKFFRARTVKTVLHAMAECKTQLIRHSDLASACEMHPQLLSPVLASMEAAGIITIEPVPKESRFPGMPKNRYIVNVEFLRAVIMGLSKIDGGEDEGRDHQEPQAVASDAGGEGEGVHEGV